MGQIILDEAYQKVARKIFDYEGHTLFSKHIHLVAYSCEQRYNTSVSFTDCASVVSTVKLTL